MREDLRDRTPLDARGQRAVAERDRIIEAMTERFSEVLLAMVCAPNAVRVRKLAMAAYRGLDPESIGWAYCSRMLDEDCYGICKQCGTEVYKNGHLDAPGCPEIYQDLCPAEFGAVHFASVCAA